MHEIMQNEDARTYRIVVFHYRYMGGFFILRNESQQSVVIVFREFDSNVYTIRRSEMNTKYTLRKNIPKPTYSIDKKNTEPSFQDIS